MKQYAKAIVALALGGLVVAATAFDVIDSSLATTTIGAIVVSLGVYIVPNKG